MRTGTLSFLLLLAPLPFALARFAMPTAPADILRLSPDAEAIFPSPSQLEELASGFTWTEGPVWIRTGNYLLFADIPSNTIQKWSPGVAKPSVFLQPSGYVLPEPYGGKEPGSNGMTLDPSGRLTIAGHARRNVWRLETPDAHGPLTVLADSYQGKKLNSPNDVVYKSDGALYFTDPPYGLASQSDHDPKKELSFNGVYRIPNAAARPAGSKPQEPQLLIQDLPRPNGLAFSPDEKFLYVANSEPQRFWMRYPVNADGSLGTGTMFFDASSDKAVGSPDGVKVDRSGNVYGAGPGGVWVFSPAGQHLATLRLPQRVANLNWGGADSRTLYITASQYLYRVQLKVPGIQP